MSCHVMPCHAISFAAHALSFHFHSFTSCISRSFISFSFISCIRSFLVSSSFQCMFILIFISLIKLISFRFHFHAFHFMFISIHSLQFIHFIPFIHFWITCKSSTIKHSVHISYIRYIPAT